MLKQILRFRAVMVIFLALSLALSCSEAFADGRGSGNSGGRGGGYRGAGSYRGGGGYRGGGDRNYYRDGRWYRHGWLGFDIAVSALAIGALIESLPPRCDTVVVRDTPYYYYGNYYYRPYQYGGYVVVPPPPPVEQPVPAGAYVVPANVAPNYMPAAAQQDSFTVNVPNSRGGYTSVTLRRSGNGFIGPQGEYYADFPSMEQLRLMYGSNK